MQNIVAIQTDGNTSAYKRDVVTKAATTGIVTQTVREVRQSVEKLFEVF
jgi:hypothetical protein